MALGAEARHVVAMIASQGGRLVVVRASSSASVVIGARAARSSQRCCSAPVRSIFRSSRRVAVFLARGRSGGGVAPGARRAARIEPARGAARRIAEPPRLDTEFTGDLGAMSDSSPATKDRHRATRLPPPIVGPAHLAAQPREGVRDRRPAGSYVLRRISGGHPAGRIRLGHGAVGRRQVDAARDPRHARQRLDAASSTSSAIRFTR